MLCDHGHVHLRLNNVPFVCLNEEPINKNLQSLDRLGLHACISVNIETINDAI